MVKKVPVTKFMYETSNGTQFDDKYTALEHEFETLTAYGIESATELKRFLTKNSEFIKEIMEEE